MTRQLLATAGDTLERAAGLVEDSGHADRLEDLAAQLERLSESDTGPDHGRLARIQSAMHDVRDAVDGDAAALVRDAHESIDEYREGLEGV